MRPDLGGEPGFAIVAGEAGVGKTRLVSELSAQADGTGFTVLTGHCVELGAEGLPLAPLIDALRTLVRTTSRAELAEVLGPVRRGLARLLPELDPGGSDEPAPDGIQVSQLLGLLGRLSARRPLLLVLEDLHWSDQSTRELVSFLIRPDRARRPAGRDPHRHHAPADPLDEDVFGRAYGLALPASIPGIVIGSAVAPALASMLGASGALVAVGDAVLAYMMLILRRGTVRDELPAVAAPAAPAEAVLVPAASDETVIPPIPWDPYVRLGR